MKHVLESLPEISRATIVGKGPSFSMPVHDGSFIVSINETFTRGFDCDLCIFNDWKVIPLIDVPGAKTYATTLSPHANVPPYDLRASEIVRYGQFFDKRKDNISFYEIHNQCAMPDYQSIQSFGSTAEAAIHLLALHGVKDFHFIGIGDPPWTPQYSGSIPHYKRLKRVYNLNYSGSMT